MLDSASPLHQLLSGLRKAAGSQTLAHLTISKPRKRSSDVRNVYVKLVQLKRGLQLSFVYHHTQKTTTHNFPIEAGIQEAEQLLQNDFYLADLFTATADYHLVQMSSGKTKLRTMPPSLHRATGIQDHNEGKNRLIVPGKQGYLSMLGITTAEGIVRSDRQDKFRQINHYVEIIRGLLKNEQDRKRVSITDMGCGKGYLSFALYDFLTTSMGWEVEMQGIEIRGELVDTCNRIAADCGFRHLHFRQGSIVDTDLSTTDLLIALHACDTATDEAIFKGIEAKAQWILTAPCCHKEIRRQMRPSNILSSITRHGILLERQAEIVTDSIRALLMESAGYKTSVFDFIATEHTPKNLMIAGTRKGQEKGNAQQISLQKVEELKSLFGIRTQHLEQLLAGRKAS